MKNAIMALVLAISVSSFCSYPKGRLISDTDEYIPEYPAPADTVPAKHPRKKTSHDSRTPYDSFGKPTKMDTTQIR